MKNSSIQCAKSATTLNPIVLHVALDVHKDSIAVAVADADREQPVRFLKTIVNDLHAVEKLVSQLRGGSKTPEPGTRHDYDEHPDGGTNPRISVPMTLDRHLLIRDPDSCRDKSTIDNHTVHSSLSPTSKNHSNPYEQKPESQRCENS